MKGTVGDIVLINLDPIKGDEKAKTRPCLIVEDGSGTALGLLIVVPVTQSGPRKTSGVFVPIDSWKAAGLSKPSSVDSYQIRCLSDRRVRKRLGAVSDDVLDQVRARLALILNIGPEHVEP